ncbi:sigma-70 family RNA polymerase sigma factor [Benzoatithermus flavus]|uniref:RNA polymerase sigma factor n=1 Tax=Benzoatithermus flavus TaxID=3108223 RepID=A0ABU8XXQ4_9PROT
MLGDTVSILAASCCLALPRGARKMAIMDTRETGSEADLEADMHAVAQMRDRSAFGRIFAFYGPRVKAYLRRLGAEDAVAEDLTQEVMLAVWHRAHQFDRSRASLSTWIFRIARNKRIDALRRERRPELDMDDPALAPDDERTLRGDRHAEVEEARHLVMRAVERLPAEQAQLLRIFYFEEKPHSAIAEEVGLPLGTVKSRLRLALSKLRALLDGLDG